VKYTPIALIGLAAAVVAVATGSGIAAGSTTTTRAASCALPAYPDASCTGVPPGTQLTVHEGDLTVSTANTVVNGLDLRGCVFVDAPGVVIRNSKVSCSGSEAIQSPDGRYTGTGLLIEDSEIDCLGTAGTGIGDTNFTARRVNVHGCENGFDLDQNVTVEDSYIHNLYNSDEAHTDGIQFAGHYRMQNGQYVRDAGGHFIVDPGAANITIRHNTIYDYNTTDHLNGTSAIISNRGGDTNVLIEANLLAGGAFTLYCEQGATGVNYRVVGNHFSTAFNPKVGAYGPTTECSDETTSGNVYHETGKPVPME
jgi:hypothetical protein